MGQTPSMLTTEQQTSLILTFPQELTAIIMSFKDKSFELALATTCKTLYERYELYYEKKTVVVLYDPWDRFSNYNDNIKALQLRNGWLRLKFTTIWDSLSSNCPAKILCLNGEQKVPKKLDHACIDALIVSSFKEFISLYKCKMVYGHLSKLLEGHTTLKEIQILKCNFSDTTSIKLPSQMKRFEVQQNGVFELVDASDCTQLEYL